MVLGPPIQVLTDNEDASTTPSKGTAKHALDDIMKEQARERSKETAEDRQPFRTNNLPIARARTRPALPAVTYSEKLKRGLQYANRPKFSFEEIDSFRRAKELIKLMKKNGNTVAARRLTDDDIGSAQFYLAYGHKDINIACMAWEGQLSEGELAHKIAELRSFERLDPKLQKLWTGIQKSQKEEMEAHFPRPAKPDIAPEEDFDTAFPPLSSTAS